MRYLTLLLALLLTSCKEENVAHYTIPKETTEVTRPKPPQPTQAPNLASQTESFKQPTWKVPAHWESKPLGQLRKGSFSVKSNDTELDISVLAFPGNVGGTLANINRWAQQINLPPFKEDLLPTLKTTKVDGHNATIVDLKGPQQSIYGIILELDTHSWFFKMTGNPTLVEQEIKNFHRFLESTQLN